MKKNILKPMYFIVVFMFLATICTAQEFKNGFNKLPIRGMPNMIDIGAKKCIPCKMMIPVMKKVEAAYKGRAAIVFIDVWEHRDQGKRFSISAIPTQIFFDKNGKEVFRHMGFLREKAIIEQFAKMGISIVKGDK